MPEILSRALSASAPPSTPEKYGYLDGLYPASATLLLFSGFTVS